MVAVADRLPLAVEEERRHSHSRRHSRHRGGCLVVRRPEQLAQDEVSSSHAAAVVLVVEREFHHAPALPGDRRPRRRRRPGAAVGVGQRARVPDAAAVRAPDGPDLAGLRVPAPFAYGAGRGLVAAACGADEVPAGPARGRRVPLGQPFGGDRVDVGQVDDGATAVEALLLPGDHGVEDERDQVVVAGAESKATSRAIGHSHE